jgi:dimethylargininase
MGICFILNPYDEQFNMLTYGKEGNGSVGGRLAPLKQEEPIRLLALTREVSPSIGRCELTHLTRQAIDLKAARKQHRRYERCLAELGCEVVRLPALPDFPDAVFVEDTALVLDEAAVIMRPGAESRREETGSVAEALKAYRRLYAIQPPGTMDGGDVLALKYVLYVGLSSRTNNAGVEQLQAICRPLGYAVKPVEIKGCLHLKSAVSRVGANTLLVNRAWLEVSHFQGLDVVEVDPSEPMAANALLLGESVIFPQAYKKTRRRLEAKGISVRTVDVTELAKAEGGVTCCSLILRLVSARL